MVQPPAAFRPPELPESQGSEVSQILVTLTEHHSNFLIQRLYTRVKHSPDEHVKRCLVFVINP